ncbi:7-deoxyloganetin glucosyltransferase-like [Cucurbita pepo subsp. pepo]|uniref:7-deoxyloganetin glucosyltransferase-like n=1 Tax=Cucurbita pepo subsp. pepo TaxID=3664 RepID=UPI000C9D7B04|nr:7-deoxyloganetin glucosyltransferase-like [Cucurbita pepo subsp. pepo]
MHKPHAVCIPFPAQSHINAMLSVAKLLHQKGFHITFVNTEYNHKRILKSRGSNSLDDLPSFRFRTIPDSMPVADDDDIDAPQDLPTLCIAVSNDFLAPFCSLLSQLNHDDDDDFPVVSCIVSDGFMSFTIRAAAEFSIPVAHFFPFSACSLWGFSNLGELVKRGITPLKDESYLTNGYLETTIDWIRGMKNIRLKDLPSFARTTNPNDIFLNFVIQETERTAKASAIILNTFDALEQEVLDVLSQILPPIYTIGPVHLFTDKTKEKKLEKIATNLWEENPNCLDWLDSNEPNSVVYVNFGSIAVMTNQNLIEFAWGLANSGKPFLWIIRPDLVIGVEDDYDYDYDYYSTILPIGFFEKIRGRGMIASWCAQKEVLKHPSVAGFLTHCGWNSIIESLCAGVPMILWPYFADQPTNCRYCCVEWGIGLEIDSDVKRDEVERCVNEVMEGEKGKDMKKKVMELKNLAEESCKFGGSSYCNLDELILQILSKDRT